MGPRCDKCGTGTQPVHTYREKWVMVCWLCPNCRHHFKPIGREYQIKPTEKGE